MAKSSKPPIVPSDEVRTLLERLEFGPQPLAEHVWRADIILRLGDGCSLI